jgi:uncharacterized protein YecT (DUF1311 family)
MNMRNKIWRNTLTCCLLSANVLLGVVHADSSSTEDINKLRPAYTDCLNKAAAVTAPTRECMNTELAYQNRRLNKAYKDLMDKLDASNKSKLLDDERTWIKYRDSICADVIYGIEQPELAGLGCSVEETAERATDLEIWLFQR